MRLSVINPGKVAELRVLSVIYSPLLSYTLLYYTLLYFVDFRNRKSRLCRIFGPEIPAVLDILPGNEENRGIMVSLFAVLWCRFFGDILPEKAG